MKWTLPPSCGITYLSDPRDETIYDNVAFSGAMKIAGKAPHPSTDEPFLLSLLMTGGPTRAKLFLVLFIPTTDGTCICVGTEQL